MDAICPTRAGPNRAHSSGAARNRIKRRPRALVGRSRNAGVSCSRSLVQDHELRWFGRCVQNLSAIADVRSGRSLPITMTECENYSAPGKPGAVAKKALNIIKRNKPAGANLKIFEIKESGVSFTAIGRSEDGVFHDSEIRVEVRPAAGDGSLVEVEAK